MSDFIQAREDAEREERERIIDLLTGDRLRVQIITMQGWVTIASEGVLREELKP